MRELKSLTDVNCPEDTDGGTLTNVVAKQDRAISSYLLFDAVKYFSKKFSFLSFFPSSSKWWSIRQSRGS